MSLSFHKLVGAGNDFIFVQEKDLAQVEDYSDLAVQLCDRHFGIGADGFVIIKNTETLDSHTSFEWDFYNNDGSFAEMCGNAARCAVTYNKLINGTETCSFKTAIGMINGQVTDKGSVVTWEIESSTPEKKTVELDYGKSFDGWFIDTGVPHFVVLDEPTGTVNGRDCSNLQTHPAFGERNTNVTVLTINGDGPHPTKSF
ncbi:MAG: diaminopimelate epimerase, partial [Bdellovibrionales bacterium]|nr:diaminopimelate epimerase [Bdellovibrionales bacterium]